MSAIGFVAFAIISPYFELKKINIKRDNPNINAQKVEIALNNFYGKNLLFLKKNDIQKTLQKFFPGFEEVQIKEIWPDAIEMQIKTSSPSFNILNQETANFSIIAENGSILESGADKFLPTIKVFDYKKVITPHQQFTSKEILEKIITANNLLDQKLMLPIKEIQFYPVAQELHLISKDDMEIWLDLNSSIALQMEKLEISANRIGLYRTPLKHIDLRIPNQLFWAPK